MPDPQPAEPFDTFEQQAHAAHFGMWVFLASEILLFSGLFALYSAYRAMYSHGFASGVAHNTKILGSVNTVVLLCSSYAVASAVLALRAGKPGRAVTLVGATVAMGVGFLVIKFIEYAKHFHEGIYPGGVGRYFTEAREPGTQDFWTLYFVTTGLHALHVTVGLLVLSWMGWRVIRGVVSPRVHHPLALAAMYWHLVDMIWIFVWPVYYLA